ncbi:hypothetical protein [Elioraea rosea]|uniref:hypothetical protein n=1 Tax=Elioraea rosea TaxID=2492390 RepID=UPI0011839E1D|nr:hypothetical protein [Elioraea rosea]
MTDLAGTIRVRSARALAAHLAAAPSVTSGLYAWCAALGIGAGPIRVLARSGGAAPPALAAMLGEEAASAAFRRVVLGRGNIALAEADNLFLPARLPAAMRARLERTDEPFGAVIAPIAPVRRTVTCETDEGPMAGAVLVQTALLHAPDGTLIAAVAERFLPVLLR